MSEKKPVNRHRKAKNLTISKFSLEQGEVRARRLGLTFTRYVESLIRKDLLEAGWDIPPGESLKV